MLGIGTSIVPRSKLSEAALKLALPLLTVQGEAVEVGFDLVWNAQTTKPDHVSALLDHFTRAVSGLVAGAWA